MWKDYNIYSVILLFCGKARNSQTFQNNCVFSSAFNKLKKQRKNTLWPNCGVYFTYKHLFSALKFDLKNLNHPFS